MNEENLKREKWKVASSRKRPKCYTSEIPKWSKSIKLVALSTTTNLHKHGIGLILVKLYCNPTYLVKGLFLALTRNLPLHVLCVDINAI